MSSNLFKTHFLLILILIFSLFLRLYGVYPGYPDIHPDESSSYGTAVHLLYNFFVPDRFDYPAGVPLINVIGYVVFFIPISLVKVIFSSSDIFLQFLLSPHKFFIQYQDAIFGNRDFYAMYWTRIITALFGSGTVWFLYVTGKKLLNKEVGLFASFFLAVNYLHIVRSHFGLPDVYNGFFVVLSVYISALVLEKPTLKRYILAGFICGMSFALKYQVFALIPFITAHIILTIRKKNIFYFFHKWGFYAAGVFILTFLITNPFYLLNINNAIKMNKQDIARYMMGILGLRPYPYWYLYHFGIGQLPSILIVLGMLAMLIRKRIAFILIFPFSFVFMFVMTYYSQGGIFTRNFAQVLPFFMLFAGYATYLLYHYSKKINKTLAAVIICLLIFVANWTNIQNSFILDYYYSQPWSETMLSSWMRAKLPQNSIVRNYQLFLHTVGGDTIKNKHITLKDWNYSKGENSFAEFEEDGTDFAILNTNPYQSITYWWRGYPQLYLDKDNVPFAFIQNNFYGLTIKELLNYEVYEAYKPWQAHYNDNYLVFKIPKKPKDLGNMIAKFSFDRNDQHFKIRGNFGFAPLSFSWSQDEGRDGKGSLFVKPGETVTSRVALDPIPVKPGKFYTVRGFIKNTLIAKDEDPEGFLRIDFYSNKDEKNLDNIGSSVAVSTRAALSGEWEEVTASGVAPADAKYATISFQFKGLVTSSYVDDIEFYESDVLPEEKFKDIPYIKSTIPVDSLYYNTFI